MCKGGVFWMDELKKKKKITLASEFSFDYTYMFGEGRLQVEEIEKLKEKIAQAAQGIEEIRKQGIVKNHFSKDGAVEPVYFTRLPYIQKGYPNELESIKELEEFGKKVRANADVVIFCGVGGSYLGGKVLYDCFTSEYWRGETEKVKGPKVFFSGNSLDAETTEHLWHQLKAQAIIGMAEGKGKLTVQLIPISKSGTTLEPTTAFLYLYEQIVKEPKLFNLQVAVVTDKRKSGPLNQLAKENAWPMFDVQDGIGGRFSVLANPGLIVATVLGMDIQEILKGARDMEESCQSSDIWQNPALLNATIKYLAGSQHGCNIEIMMPYAIRLKSLGEWYVQLLAESLGKRLNRNGKEVFYGRTPVVAIGTTDMHAQTQLHQDGVRNKVVQFVEVGGRNNRIVLNEPFSHIDAYAKYAGLDLNRALLVALQANEEALDSDNRFSARYYLPKINEYYLGQMFYFLMLSIAYEGELANVDAYDQPGVEIYKKIMHNHLG